MSEPPPLLPRAALRMGFLGLLPLAATALLSLAQSRPAAHLGLIGFVLYAACLLSFLGGVRCGIEIMRAPHAPSGKRLLFSAMPALAGWTLALLVAIAPPIEAAAAAFAGLFAAQGYWDQRSASDAGAPAWYPVLRQVLTGGAMIVCMILLFGGVAVRPWGGP